MLHRDFQGKQLSMLGFGAMRLPLLEDKSIDEAQVFQMVDYALEHGINYFDTAYPYHGGLSEIILGRALARHPRDSFYLASKYPGHQPADRYDPASIFEEQLDKCGVDHFDFYLLHNVSEFSIDVYMDPQWGILDYFLEQKRLGRIGHLGFSSHGGVENLERFLDHCGQHMEFCQIQLNYLDWTLQDAKGKVELLASRGIPIWVMEPVRGGRLAKLDAGAEERLKALRPGDSIASWAFRWLMSVPQPLPTVILSGMSDMAQMRDNVATFEDGKGLSADGIVALQDIAASMYDRLPCTACRYCCDGCPMGLDIPFLLGIYDEARFAPSVTVGMRVESIPEDRQPAACIGCGACVASCPQGIDIPTHMQALAELLEKTPKWRDICRERAAAAEALRKKR
ncbi:MAG: aldo/keto reductase [Coriobacteriales bacterium]|nr:aldo/keto reductase [Coriobacteriales bacterium]MBQ6586543.1 aldo/keto reductase [Coriobacteriales bacterium]